MRNSRWDCKNDQCSTSKTKRCQRRSSWYASNVSDLRPELPQGRAAGNRLSGLGTQCGRPLRLGEGESPLRNDHMRAKLELPSPMAIGSPLLLGGGGLRGVAAAPAPLTATGAGAGGNDDAGAPRLLDLHELFGIHGLLTGNQKNLVPASVSSKLCVPAGEAGVANGRLRRARLSWRPLGEELLMQSRDYLMSGASPGVQVRVACY